MNLLTGLLIFYVVIFTILFFKYPRWLIAGLIIIKPIIDLSWNYYIIDDINLLEIISGTFVVLGTIYIIYYRIKILQSSISLPWLLFICLNFISIFIIKDSTLLIDKIDYILRILNGFVFLVLVMHLFNNIGDKKLILSIFIASGIIPMLLWLIPVLAGNPIVSSDELQRIIGPYYDFWNFNFYGMQTVICCLVYLAISNKSELKANNAKDHWCHKISNYLKNSVSLKSVMLYIMIIISILMVYKCYSKAGWITLITIFLIWFVLRKKFISALLVVLISVIIVLVNPFAGDFQKTFRNEINYFIHDSDTKEIVFRGRLNRWETGMSDFITSPVINKLFGGEISVRSPENYYLRVLWDNGIVGFVIFLILLGLTGYLLIRKYAKNKDPIALLGILVWLMYLLSSIGAYPMLYPAFQWFMWGIIGLLLSENKTNSKGRTPGSKQ